MTTVPWVGWVTAVTVSRSPRSASVSLPNTSMTVGLPCAVVTVSATASGVLLKKVRVISLRTQPSTAHSSGGSAGATGPGAKNGERNAATNVVAMLTMTPGSVVIATTG